MRMESNLTCCDSEQCPCGSQRHKTKIIAFPYRHFGRMRAPETSQLGQQIEGIQMLEDGQELGSCQGMNQDPS